MLPELDLSPSSGNYSLFEAKIMYSVQHNIAIETTMSNFSKYLSNTNKTILIRGHELVAY
jgi:hypothetical protein